MRLSRRAPRRSVEGVAYVEFLLAFVPIFTLFLGVIQIALMYSASILVQHSANRAARSAVVVADDDPQFYAGSSRGAPRHSFAGPPLSASELRAATEGLSRGGSSLVLSRRATVELAAALVLAPLSPERVGSSVAESLRSGDAPSRAAATRDALTVRFRSGADGVERDTFEPGEAITVDVEYRYACAIPVVRTWVCRSGNGTTVLRGRATLPSQSAPFPYRSEL